MCGWDDGGGAEGVEAGRVGYSGTRGEGPQHYVYYCTGAVLVDAIFSEAMLEGADFTGADISSAKFTGSELTGAVFTNATGMQTADWVGATGL